jgi:hypothetical protein
MANLIDTLRSFNRKERFYLVGMALGNESFKLSQEFRERVRSELNLDVPGNAFAAMDYHLDWIFASLFCSRNGNLKPVKNVSDTIRANIQDVDFLIAFTKGEDCHLLMLEVKAEMGWSNHQLISKAERLKGIFGNDGKNHSKVIPHFALVSPKASRNLKTEEWPEWMKQPSCKAPYHMKLPMPSPLKRVERCDKDGNRAKSKGYWKVV